MSSAIYTPYLRLEVRRTLRNPRAIMFTAAIPLLMYVLFSSTSQPDATHSAEWIHRAVLASMVAYGAIGGALLASGPPLAAERATGWLRQLSATPLPANAAVVAKIGVCLALAAAGSTVVAVIGAVTGAHLSAVTVVELVVAMTLGAVCFGMLGLLYGASIKRPETAQGATIITYLGMSAIGGLWVPTDQFPSWLEHISQVLPSYHVNQLGFAIVQGEHLPLGSVAALIAWTVVLAAAASVAWRRGTRAR